MTEAKIYIKKPAIEEIYAFVSQKPRLECEGQLKGEKIKKLNENKLLYIVECTVPYGYSKRTPNSVQTDNGSRKRSEFSLFYKKIGEYHSHVTSIMQKNGEKYEDIARVKFSKSDKEFLKESPKNIELVIAIRKIEVKKKISNDNPMLISFYVGKNEIYRVDIGGYYCDPLNSKIRRASLDAPEKVLRGLA